MSVLNDSEEFGRRIASARAYAGYAGSKPKFAKLIGTSDTTLGKWEDGDFSSRYQTEDQRRHLAQRIAKAAGSPPEWFGLVDVNDDDALREKIEEGIEKRIEELSAKLRALLEVSENALAAEEPLPEQLAAEQESDEEAALRQRDDASGVTTESPKRKAQGR